MRIKEQDTHLTLQEHDDDDDDDDDDIYQVMWQHVVERHVLLYDMLPHHLIYKRRNFTEYFNINITLVMYR